MNRNVYLFLAILLILLSPLGYSGKMIFNVGPDSLKHDHGKHMGNRGRDSLHFGRLSVGLDFNYLKSTSQYDADGNKQDYFGGDTYTRLNEIIYGRYKIGRFNIGGSKWKLGATAIASFIQEKWKPGDQNTNGTEQTNNGMTFTFGPDFSTRRIGGARLNTYLGLRYQIDATKESKNATDRQNALGVNFKLKAPIGHGPKLFFGADYWYTFPRTETQMVYDPNLLQFVDKDVDYDEGNQYAIYGGGEYKWCWGSCGWAYFGASLSYWNKTKISYDGNAIDNTDENLLSVIPKIGFRWKKVPLDISVSGSFRNEYNIQQGAITLSGKNSSKPSLALEARINYRF